MLVYTFGFLSILLFTAIIGQAGYVSLVIFDDFFKRRHWDRLTKGWPSLLLWFSIFVLWIVLIAGVAGSWSKNRANAPYSFSDAMWFSYISVLTVGFGDFYIPPDLFRPSDMLYLPLLFLIGFVLLANFLLKLSDVILDNMKSSQKPSLESILGKTRANTNSATQQPQSLVD